MTFAPPERLLAKLLREVLRGEQFEHVADVKEALKVRCATRRIPYDADLINRACDLVGSNRALVQPPRRPAPDPVADPPMGRDEAALIVRRLRQYLPTRAVKPMPSAYGLHAGIAANRAHATAVLRALRCPTCQHQGAQLSGVQLGWLFCVACHHTWELPVSEPGERSLVEWRGDKTND